MLNKFLNDNKAILYALFRIVVGLLFLLHGAQKFGLLSGGFGVPSDGLMALAGIIELVVGILIILGIRTEDASVVGAIEMIYAFIVVHTFGDGFNINPLTNNGEKALLFLVVFFVLATLGPGKLWVYKMKKK